MKTLFFKSYLFVAILLIGSVIFLQCKDNENPPPPNVENGTPPPVDGNAIKTPGTLSFSVKTITANGKYQPQHVMAIWITNNKDQWIKTLQMKAEKRKEYLTTFAAKSGFNAIDASTGSTLGSHIVQTVTWNGKNASATLVEDGEYKVYVEFTENNAQGPVTSYIFTKGTNSVSLIPANQTNFSDVSLSWTPTP